MSQIMILKLGCFPIGIQFRDLPGKKEMHQRVLLKQLITLNRLLIASRKYLNLAFLMEIVEAM